ncbi:hypothetical protein E2C01_010695 [Portunus trituberculatus]|uniref:Uncharacterized protein n=1 Tax=Portunus trituberculatus TaxID=210409 RepID=A0A5B7D937_PORTR|nr:hypothetical protein [Portunus trituberculatus]
MKTGYNSMVPTPTNAGSMWKWNVKQNEKTSKEDNTIIEEQGQNINWNDSGRWRSSSTDSKIEQGEHQSHIKVPGYLL